MGNTRNGFTVRVPFTMHIDVELWKRVVACTYDKNITKVSAVREGLKMWLAANENKAA